MEKKVKEEILAILWNEIVEKNNASRDVLKDILLNSSVKNESDKQIRYGRCWESSFRDDSDSIGVKESDPIEILISENLIRVSPDGKLGFTDEGYNRAKKIVRLHRLAERLLHDVLGVKGGEMHIAADELEHIISPSVEESICALLGHPRLCPHGSRIPEGECCIKRTDEVKPIIATIDTIPIGSEARLAYIYTDDHSLLHKLLSMGFMPGTLIKLHQKYPTLVVNVGSTMVALEENVAKSIFVRK